MTSDIQSRQVNWWSVHEFVLPTLIRVQSWPMAGTPTWADLDDNDPAKLAAIFDAARHHALRVDTAQAAHAEASRAISRSANWSRITRTRSNVYIPREVA